MGILLWILLGLIAGWLASFLMGTTDGLLGDMLLGIVGALLGGFVMNALGAAGITGFNIYSMLVATLGAVLLIAARRALV